MAKMIAILALVSAVLAFAQTAYAQRGGNLYRVGFLSPSSATAQKGRFAAFLEGLKEAGYENGRNIVVDARYADGWRKRLPSLAAELVASGVDVIVAQGAAARAAKDTVTTVPVILIQSDPVAGGLVDSLAHPGGNFTGLASQGTRIVAKRLQLLKQAVPSAARVAVLLDPTIGSHRRQFAVLQQAAPSLGVALAASTVALKTPDDLDRALTATLRKKPHGLIVLGYSTIRDRRKQIAEFALRNRLPTIFSINIYVAAGALMAYGPDMPDLFRRAAHYVDKILKGAKPSELPVEYPTKFQLAINLKTAKAIGVSFPPSILLRATKVVE